VRTFKFRETLELIKMGNPEPNPVFRKQTKVQKAKIKKDRCRDSMEAVLTNGVDCVALVKESFHRNFRKDEG
jgi:hypothetical protein